MCIAMVTSTCKSDGGLGSLSAQGAVGDTSFYLHAQAIVKGRSIEKELLLLFIITLYTILKMEDIRLQHMSLMK